jgi:ribosomal protein S27AE
LSRNALIRFSVAGLTGGIAGVSLVGILGVLDAKGLAGCSLTSGWGVFVPIITGLFIGGAAWGFLAVPDERTAENSNSRRECPECGGTILGDWRLCPHCGARLPEVTAEQPSC